MTSSVVRSTSSIFSRSPNCLGVVLVDVGFQRGENALFLRFPVEPARLPVRAGPDLRRRRPGLVKLLLKLGISCLQFAKSSNASS